MSGCCTRGRSVGDHRIERKPYNIYHRVIAIAWSDVALTNRRMVLVSGEDKAGLFTRLCHKNFIRRELGIRLIHIPTVYNRKVKLMTEDRYVQLLEPILGEKFRAVDWPTGFTARLLLAVKLHKQAVQQVYNDHGVDDPRTTNPDLLKIIERLAPAVDCEIPINGGM